MDYHDVIKGKMVVCHGCNDPVLVEEHNQIVEAVARNQNVINAFEIAYQTLKDRVEIESRKEDSILKSSGSEHDWNLNNGPKQSDIVAYLKRERDMACFLCGLNNDPSILSRIGYLNANSALSVLSTVITGKV